MNKSSRKTISNKMKRFIDASMVAEIYRRERFVISLTNRDKGEMSQSFTPQYCTFS